MFRYIRNCFSEACGNQMQVGSRVDVVIFCSGLCFIPRQYQLIVCRVLAPQLLDCISECEGMMFPIGNNSGK